MSQGRQSVNHPAGRRGPRTNTNERELRRRRILAGMTLEELAGKAGSSKGYLSDIENDNGNASQPLLLRLANALGCSVSDLMLDGDDGRAAL